MAFVVALIHDQPTLLPKIKRLRSTSPTLHVAVYIKAVLANNTYFNARDVVFVVRSVYPIYSTLYCLNPNGAPALFYVKAVPKKKILTLIQQKKLPCGYIYSSYESCPINL